MNKIAFLLEILPDVIKFNFEVGNTLFDLNGPIPLNSADIVFQNY